MNKTMYRAPETRIISEDYTSYLTAASGSSIYSISCISEDIEADAKSNVFVEPTGEERSLGTGTSNPWSGREDDDM